MSTDRVPVTLPQLSATDNLEAPQRYSCYRVAGEIGMVEDPNGAWVPAFDYLRLLDKYRQLLVRPISRS